MMPFNLLCSAVPFLQHQGPGKAGKERTARLEVAPCSAQKGPTSLRSLFEHMETSFRGCLEVGWENVCQIFHLDSETSSTQSSAMSHQRESLASFPACKPIQTVTWDDSSVGRLTLNHGSTLMWRGRVDTALEN